MERFTYTQPPSEEFIRDELEKRELNREDFRGHSAEDYTLVSESLPIVCVADGVTLELAEDQPYPEPSGAAEVSRVFCEVVLRELEQGYSNLSESGLPGIFSSANESIGEYNASQNRVAGKLNYSDLDLFATTGAFAAVKDDMVYWGSICDSYILGINAKNQIFFQSPPCNADKLVNLPDNYSSLEPKEQKIFTRREMRNGLDSGGRPIGYGVATGEPAAGKYFNFGSFPLVKGDIIAAITDGFENYIRWYSFRKLLRSPTAERIDEYSSEKIAKDPSGYGRERTLAVLR